MSSIRQTLSLQGVFALLLAVLSAQPAGAVEPSEGARQAFDHYVTLGHNDDPALADLYAPDAVVRGIRIHADGRTVEAAFTGDQYAQLLRRAMAVLAQSGARSEYSDITYRIEADDRVRIDATRHAVHKGYKAPFAITFARQADGRWLVVEEVSEERL